MSRRLGLLLGAASFAALSLSGTVSAQEVVMRRPLPSADASDPNSVPNPGTPTPAPTPGQNCDSLGNCSPGTPTPSTPVSTPTSTTIPGSSYDPDIVPVVDNPPSNAFGVATWVTGQWQGSGQCGQTATYTRDVSCVVVGQAATIPVISMTSPDGRVQNASYSPDASPATLAPAIYDPESTDVKAMMAQFGGTTGSDGLKRTTMPAQYCMDNGAGPPPANSYTGTQGGCEYHEQDDGSSDWRLDPGSPGTVSCSAQAYRLPNYSCFDQDGNQVDLGFCVENIRSGGDRNLSLTQAQYGNFAGCRAGWVGSATDNLCYKPTQVPGQTQPGEQFVDGPDHYAYYTYSCMREDQTILTGPDEAACTAPRPNDEWRVVGSCVKTYYTGGSNHCVLGDDDEHLLGQVLQSEDPTNPYTGGSGMCARVNAACCGSRITENYDVNDGQTVTVASDLPPVRQSGYFFDEVNKRRDSTQEGVLSLWYGANIGTYEEAPQTIPPTDDPDGIVNNNYSSGPTGPIGGPN